MLKILNSWQIVMKFFNETYSLTSLKHVEQLFSKKKYIYDLSLPLIVNVLKIDSERF